MSLRAQQVIYNFDDCTLTESTGTWPDAITTSQPDCQCGATQNGLYLDGNQNHIILDSDMDTLLLGDFTLSFYFRIDEATARTDIFSIRSTCQADSVLAFTYEPASNNLVLQLAKFTIHTRALTSLELTNNDLQVDQIVTRDTTIIQGESVSVVTGPTCATTWTWTPTASIDDPTALDIVVTPDETTTYTINLVNSGNCLTSDTVTIFVLDEDALDCDNLLLPNAFTPNNDFLNDSYGISNLFLVEDLEFFEIYNRWGAKVWETNEKSDTWDGNYGGTAVNPGMFIYKIKYTCQGQEFVKLDNFSVLR